MSLKFANPERCRGSNVIQAAQELAAARSCGTLRLHASNGSLAKEIIVDYEPFPEIVRITAIGPSIPKVTMAMQVDNDLSRTWPVNIVWPEGEAVLSMSFSTRQLRFEVSNNSDEPRVVIPAGGFWKKIEGRGNVPTSVVAVIKAIVAEINTGPRDCAGTAAWCAKYGIRFLGSGSLCALSFGSDGIACQDALDAHCSWCDCKGYACQACN